MAQYNQVLTDQNNEFLEHIEALKVEIEMQAFENEELKKREKIMRDEI